jgi:hypothetical protein
LGSPGRLNPVLAQDSPDRIVDLRIARQFADSVQALLYETSAKENQGLLAIGAVANPEPSRE